MSYEQRMRELESIIESNVHLVGLDPHGPHGTASKPELTAMPSVAQVGLAPSRSTCIMHC